MVSSTNVTDQELTTENWLTSATGSTFVNGRSVEDPSNQATSTLLGLNIYSEFQFLIKLTNNAISSSYCLVVKSGSSNLTTYTKIPEISFRALATSYNQNQYRLYANNDSSTPETALAAQNTGAGVAPSSTVRLRLNIGASGFNGSGQVFKLQYATSTATSSSVWTDVGRIASTTIWQGYHNTSTSDGATLPTTLLSLSTVAESYEEENNAAIMPNTIPTGGYGEWDWVLKNNNAPSGSYYFRMVFSNGSALETYTRYPLISSVGETNLDETHYQWLKDEAGGSVWTQATSAAQWITRIDHTSVVYNNLMWVIGGYTSIPNNDVWYSSDGITWTQATSAAQWTTRYDHTSVVYNNLMWVIGGLSSVRTNDVWYSSDGITWTRATSAAQWVARHSHTSVVYNNLMWVIGANQATTDKNDVWYSSDGITWTQATSAAQWTARFDHTSVVYNNLMWVIGGNNAGNLNNDVWYSTSGVTWTQAVSAAQWTARRDHASVVYGDKMWVIGGLGDSTYLRDVWSASLDSMATEDTYATTTLLTTTTILRVQINNSGGSTSTAFTIWYAQKSGATCDAPGGDETYTQVPVDATTQHWEMASSANVINQDLTSNWLTSPPGGLSTFVDGRSVEDPSNQATSTTLGGNNYSEFEFVIKLTGNVNPLTNYCFIIKSGSGNLQTYTKIPEIDILETVLEETHYRWYEDSLSSTESSVAFWNQVTSSANWLNRWQHDAVVYDNKMWVMGGNIDPDIDKNDVWYSTSGVTWTQATAGANWSARRFHGTLVFDNKMWVMGGIASGTDKNDVWYSTSGVTWTQATAGANWSPRFGFGLGLIGDAMMIVGGASSTAMADSWYSFDGITWTDIGSTYYGISGRYRFDAVAFNNRLYLAGGVDENTTQKNDVWYTTDILTWTKARENAEWLPRQDHRMLSSNNKLWVLGGQNASEVFNDIWFSSDGVNWAQQINEGGGMWWSARAHQAAVFYNNQPWILGGWDRVNNLNDIWQGVNLTPLAPEDTYATTTSATTTILRVQINNSGGPTSTAPTIWYAQKSGATCDAPGGDETYTQVPVTPTTEHWSMASATLITNQGQTGSWLTAATGSIAVNGRFVEAPSNQATSTTLGVTKFAEFGFALTITPNVISGASYCFIIKSGSDNLNTYTKIPEIDIDIVGGINYTQANYRWYENTNSSTVVTALAVLNTSTTVASGTIVRLRTNILVADATSSNQAFKLQFATSAASAASAWTDVGRIASTTIWRGYNNALPTDGETLPTLLLTSSTIVESYEEENNSTSSPNTIPVGGYGEWDWVLQSNGAATGTTYYFRMVQSNGSALNSYSNYPMIRVGRHYLVQSNYQWRNDDGNAKPPGMFWTMATAGAQWPKRYGHASLIYNDGGNSGTGSFQKPKMWILGGASTSAMNDTWFTTDGISWTQATTTNFTKRYGHTAQMFNGKMWVFGGYTGTVYLNSAQSLGFGETSWVSYPNMPWGGRNYHASTMFNGKMWILGGVSTSRMNDVWFSDNGETWMLKTSAPGWSKRSGLSAFEKDGKIWIAGGFDGTNYLNDVWYSNDGMVWTQVATATVPWQPRSGQAGVNYFGAMMFSGGTSSLSGYSDFWTSMDGFSWTQATSTAQWPLRDLHTMAMYEERLWIMGGRGVTPLNDVWYMGSGSSKAPESTFATLTMSSATRLRVQVFNEGDMATSVQLALYQGKRVGSTCDAPGGDDSYNIIGATGDSNSPWVIGSSTHVTDAEILDSSIITEATGSVSYTEGKIITYPSFRSGATTLGPGQYSEFEFMVSPYGSASTSADYCFIVQNDALDRYDNPGQGQIQATGTAASITGVSNMTVTVADGSTAIPSFTVTAGAGALGAVTVNNDLRVRINTAFPMEWNASDTLATIGGTGSSSVSNTVTYENSNKTLVLNITSNLSLGDTITVSDLGFRNFTTAASASTSLGIILSGAGGARDASTDKFVTIRGRLALGDHTAGLETNKIGETDSSVSGAELFSFGLVPTGESATATQLVINLSDVQGFGATDFSNLIVYRDDNSDGSIGGGETTTFASSGTVSLSGSDGSITFNVSSTQSSSTTYYILKGNISNIGEDYTVGFWMDGTNVSSTGQTSGVGLARSGGASKAKHTRVGGKRRGGGATDGGAAAAANQGGGGGAGGGTATTTTATSTSGGGEGGGEAAP